MIVLQGRQENASEVLEFGAFNEAERKASRPSCSPLSHVKLFLLHLKSQKQNIITSNMFNSEMNFEHADHMTE